MPPADQDTITALLEGQPNPVAPTITEAAHEALDTRGAQRFLDALRDASRHGRGRRRQAHVYLTAEAPR
jgi:hypothetical protein